MKKIMEIIIPIPKPKTFKYKVLMNGTDVTNRITESEWTKPVTIGIGYFKFTIINTGGQYSDIFAKGQTVLAYADNIGGVTRIFYGKIDYVQEKISKQGQFLEIEGRHRSKKLSRKHVCYEKEADHGTILKTIIDANLSGLGFTYTKVQLTGKTIKVRWLYKPFWDCVIELCQDARFDCYVDDDLDVHFFPENSITNDQATVANDNFIKDEGVGVDDYNEVTRVIVEGQDELGLPIVYTAKISGEGTEIIEEYIKDSNLKTMAQVKNLADGRLSELTNRPPQGSFRTYLLHEVSPGDNIPFILPRQKIYSYYKVLSYTHTFGTKVGPPQTVLEIEKEIGSTETILKKRVEKEQQLRESGNVNKLDDSLNISFNSDSQTYSSSDVVIQGGVLKLASGKTSGWWVSETKTALSNVSLAEMKYKGTELGATASLFKGTFNNESSYVTLTKETLTTIGSSDTGLTVRVRIELASDATNPNPSVDGVALMFT